METIPALIAELDELNECKGHSMTHLRCRPCARRATDGYFELAPGQYGLPASNDGPAERLRIVNGHARHPTAAQRTMTIHTSTDSRIEPLPMDHYDCDLCGEPIRPGDDAVAVTAWPAARPEPPSWETEYLDDLH